MNSPAKKNYSMRITVVVSCYGHNFHTSGHHALCSIYETKTESEKMMTCFQLLAVIKGRLSGVNIIAYDMSIRTLTG